MCSSCSISCFFLFKLTYFQLCKLFSINIWSSSAKGCYFWHLIWSKICFKIKFWWTLRMMRFLCVLVGWDYPHLVFWKRRETANSQPCIKDHTWPTYCKFHCHHLSFLVHVRYPTDYTIYLQLIRRYCSNVVCKIQIYKRYI